ncbi:MAG: biotin/lipoyl-binding protein, partial [Deltaproteobacteria bacterium]|nr:biotin/lipoyl-binding protein [Deltaproteobacteria bacterium]
MNVKRGLSVETTQASNTETNGKKAAKRISFVVPGVLTVLILGVAIGLMPRLLHKNTLVAETRKLAVSSVALVSPAPGQSTAGLPLPAEIKAWAEASIYARVNGYLVKRYVDIGSQVTEGQLLAEIDTPELDQELARAKGQLVQAEAAVELAGLYSARWAFLLKSGFISDQENADKQADLKLKAAAVDSARAEVRRLEKLLSFNRLTAPFEGTITVRNI